MKKYLLLSFLSLIFITYSHSQNLYLPLNRDIYQEYDSYLNNLDVSFHSAMKPYRMEDITNAIKVDSLDICYGTKQKHEGDSWLKRKLSYEHLFVVDSADYMLRVDPLFDIDGGQSKNGNINKSTHANTRGVMFEGNIGKTFSFSASYYENQAVFPEYISQFVRDTNNNVVPGEGRVKDFKKEGFDYGIASGYISYTPSKHFSFQFGTDKNFIGEGYRSLFLSDNAFNYPFLKITTNIWKLQYTNLYCSLLDLRPSPIAQPAEAANQFFSRKYMTSHYLSWNVSKRVNIGIFESIIFCDTLNHGAFRVDYLNPIIFYRPIEYSLGSPNNALLGASLNIKINNNNKFYSQVLLDEFVLDSVKHYSNGWWGNKQAIQAGIKSNNIFGVNKLRFQTELNWVRPYTYSHGTNLQNYGHYNQSLADPLGANFYESISFLSYRSGRWFMEAKFNYAVVGTDTAGINFGQDIWKTYNDSTIKVDGNHTTQGLKNTIMYNDFRVSYLVNRAYNINIEAAVSLRSQVTALQSTKNTWFSFGIKTSLTNHYYDF